MASLATVLNRRFSRLVGRVVRGDRPRLGTGTPLRVEWLESRDLFSVNPIVAENLLPGTPQTVWDVAGAGDPTIQGFSTDISVNQGQTVNFKINDTALAPYRIDIYRLGYYQGLGARFIATIPASQNLSVVQPSPKFDPSTALVDAGNWSVTASWAVPATATSGVYFARVTRNDTGGAFMIQFIVRADSSHSQVLFQTSDSTWQAYNTWGGYSLYQATATSPVLGAAYAVSYNRPLTIRGTPGGLGDTNSFFYGEYPMVRWMEANGYDVSYFTDMDADRNGSQILNHQLYVSAGHDEYWSGNQFNNVMAARDAGVNLAFFSGNEAFWKTYFAPSIDGTGTPNRTLVCYKETHFNAIIDPNNPNVWTGTWMDPRFSPPADGGRPQNQLTGTLFTVNRGTNDTGTPFTVPYSYSQLRFWRNTSVAQLTPGQTATLGDFVLGYEWDEDVDNGFRPTGLIDLSSTTQNVTQKFTDYGSTVAPGVATHSLTLYRASSGALVFGAGTVQYDWGLDGYHDGASGQFGFNSTPVLAMQQATVNLFADMYVQPGSLQSNLIAATASTDVIAPQSVITSPAAGAGPKTGTPVTITGTAVDSGGGAVGGVEVSVDGGQSWHPAVGTTNWSYTWVPTSPGSVTIRSRATDDNGNVEIPAAGVAVSVAFQTTSRTGLVGEYGFNDGSGTTLTDSSGSHNNGTISNGTWVNGFSGKALSFNGTNTWVTIPNSASLNLTSGMTLEAWVKPSAIIGASSIIMKEQTGGLAYTLYAANDGPSPPTTVVDVGGTDYTLTSTSSNLPVGVWSQLAATYDGSNLKLYLNGNLVGSQSISGLLTTSTGVLRIGGNSIWGEYFNGLIDDVRIYNRALNQAEIFGDMSAPIGGTIETTSPSVALTGLISGSSVSGATTLSANATDAVVVASVQFLLDGNPLGAAVTAAPYTLAWDSRTIANGSHTLSARAVNGVGLATTSTPIGITVNNAPDTISPAVRITNPPSGTFATGLTVVSAVATDNLAVTGVQFQLNGTNIGPPLTVAPYRLGYDFTSVADGNYSLAAVARDAAGNLTTSSPVTITIDHTAPTILGATPAANATGVSTASNFTVTFSEAIQPGSLVVSLKDSSNSPVQVSVQYDDTTHTATVTHGTIALDPLTTYTATVSGVRDLAGNTLAAPFSQSFSTASSITGATIWANTATPVVSSANDASAVELGVKFRSDLAGIITGVRFYKGPLNTGTHVGHLWTATGTLLATVSFTGETPNGWQQANFSTPVTILPNTTYVVSYYAPIGGYAVDSGFFATSSVNSGPLHALADGLDGSNGLFLYGSGGGFPTSSFGSSNYWVDIVFSSTTQSTTPPAITGESPLPAATSVAANTTVTATFSKTIQANTIVFTLRDSLNNVVPGSVAYNSATSTATFTPGAPLAATTTYTATVSGATDLSGNVMAAPFSWSFTTANPGAPPTVTAVTPTPGSGGVVKSTTVTATFSKTINDAVLSFVVKDSAGAVIPGTLVYNNEASVATFTPSNALNSGTTYTTTISNVLDLSGNAMAVPYTWSFTTAFALVGSTIWPSSATPTVASANDSSAVELGVKFTSDVAGSVTGLRFYKGAANTGTHLGHLWDALGNLLATVTFTGETATGWQQANFSTPVGIQANTTYVVSYYAPSGGYAYTSGQFTSAGVDAAPLHALSNTAGGGNGVYRYGAGGGFPNSTYNATNYWVDTVFTAGGADTTPPTVTGSTPAAGATGISVGTTVTAVFSEAVQPGTISFVLKDPLNNSVPASVVYDATSRTATLTPTTALVNSTTYTATVSAKDLAGNVMTAPASWSFTTHSSTYTLWNASATPAVASANDSSAIELGVKFTSDVAGSITGLRFYKGTANTGTHVGHLWDSAGNLLATVTFSGETVSGWQQANFSSPVAMQANATYVVSYYAPSGGYSYTSGQFANAGVDAAPLHALSNAAGNGNGVYRYGLGGGFPNGSYNATNYWVDPVFSTVTDTTPPVVIGKTPADGTTGVLTSTTITVTFSEAVQPGSISLVLKDSSNNVNIVSGSLTYDSVAHTATFTPSSSLAGSTNYTTTVVATDLAGNPMAAPVSWSFTTAATHTIWSSSATPAVASANDSSAVELGVKFTSDVAGSVTGLRFYKGAANTGTHLGHLWDAAGNLLATVTFTGESATGWQQANFSTPVAIQANTTYVVSYYAPSGGYAYTSGQFASAGVDAAPLHALSNAAGGGNGVFRYGTGGGFPNGSYNATNYWVDVVFS